MSTEILHLTYYDRLLIGVIIIAIIIGFVYFGLTPVPHRAIVEIEVSGSVVQTLDLLKNEGQTLSVAGKNGYSIIQVGKNKIKMVDSTCKDKICVHTGWISRPGQQIVCLPNQVVIRFKTKQAELDGING